MANPDGTPIWYELATSDADGAEAFYAAVVGWSIAPFGGEGAGRDYRILTAAGGGGVGGIRTQPAGASLQPGWSTYIGVQDVDAAAERVEALGGSVALAPQDIPGVGRFAAVADAQGMPFFIMRGDSPEDSRAFDPAAAGHCSWHELVTSDQPAALAFYRALFGWENVETMPMGEMGDYSFIDHAGVRIGAVMQAGGGFPTRWTYYFRVPSIAAAVAAVASAGGVIVQGPHPVPGGDHIVMGTDPQGTAFALVGGA